MCSSPVTTTLTTTEGNVKEPIAGISGTDDYSFQDTSSAPIHTSTPRLKCTRCVKHRKKNKALTKQHNRLKKRFIKLHEKFKLLQACEDSKEESNMEEQAFPGMEEGEQGEQADSSSDQDWEEDDEDDTNYAQLEDSAPSAEDYSSQSDDDTEGNDSSSNIRVGTGTPSYEEPKFIVFFSMLLSLFTMVCFKCKKSEPRATMKQRGTMVVVSQHCTTCGDNAFSWRSQPLIFGKYPAGNMLLSFGVLMAGASISKVLLVMRHMGLCGYSARTFFVHQKNFLFPVILNYWEQYRASLVGKLKNMANVVWSGDGRFDSMGHSAKYGAYTMFCNTILKVVHFELLQANETGGSSPMELEGAKRSFSFLKSVGLSISVFISDRHRGIAKWIRECQPSCAHFFDIWHIARSIGKAMIKLSKEKGCEKIGDWIKGVRNHLYWCVTSTKQGFQELIAAKWQSFMQHVSNKHDGHPNPMFTKCAHEEIGSRRWIKIGTKAYDKLHKLLTSVRLVNDIKRMSPDAQTSCLEGFHSTLNHWHPKMVCFSWLGTFCRHILASLHFNENVRRERKKSKDGEDYLKVTFPKFKLGEEVVREIAVMPTYGYVEELKKGLFGLRKSELTGLLNKMTEKYQSKIPASLSSQFPDRLNKKDAVDKYLEKQEREATKLHPVAEEQDVLQSTATSTTVIATRKRKRRPGKCHTCGKPMLGHNAAACKSKK
ncbi:uncharacterized protein [Acropora muricata]|uniref:uncharacterized protein n=1 Tax=Acropora muricata TaxID=159855 RepID=UPI0034E50A79